MGVVLALVALVLVAAELIARPIVNAQIVRSVTESLPDGVTAEVDAHAGGWCLLCQLAEGRLERIELHGDPVTVNGLEGRADVEASGFSLTEPHRVEALSGTVSIDQDALGRILAIPGLTGEVMLDEGSASYRASLDIFGTPTDVEVTATARVLPDGRLLLQATRIALADGSGGGSANLDPTIFSYRFCLADYLPNSLRVTGVSVHPGSLTADVEATGPLTIDDTTFTEPGRCSG